MSDLGNPFNELVSNMISMQLSSISTQETVNNCNTYMTNANQELSEKWTSCKESNSNDPGYTAYYYLMEVAKTPVKLPPGVSPPSLPAGCSTAPTTIAAWVSTFLGASGASLDNFSSVFLTEVYNVYEKNPPSSKDNSTLGLISNVSNLIQAAAQSDEQTGQNGINQLNSLQQHFETDQGPLSSATTTIIDGLSNYASAMSSISP